MRRHIRMARPDRNFSTMARAPGLTVVGRSIARKDTAKRTKHSTAAPPYATPSAPFQVDPYLDYGRFLTPEGGILIVYKDLDLRWRHTIWRLLASGIFTGLESNYIFKMALIQNQWLAFGALMVAAVVNWFIVAKPVELYRRVEIRPDCMIIEGDVFWARFMEGGLPNCRPGTDGTQVFCGVYGTRFVEFLTIRRFDDMDRMPEVMSAHLQDAMRQLWMVPH